jgi:hypothetical protein
MAGPLELLTKLSTAAELTMDKVTELGQALGNQLTNVAEGAAQSVEGAGNGATKAMAYLTDKATGMGQEQMKGHAQDKSKDDGMEM